MGGGSVMTSYEEYSRVVEELSRSNQNFRPHHEYMLEIYKHIVQSGVRIEFGRGGGLSRLDLSYKRDNPTTNQGSESINYKNIHVKMHNVNSCYDNSIIYHKQTIYSGISRTESNAIRGCFTLALYLPKNSDFVLSPGIDIMQNDLFPLGGDGLLPNSIVADNVEYFCYRPFYPMIGSDIGISGNGICYYVTCSLYDMINSISMVNNCRRLAGDIIQTSALPKQYTSYSHVRGGCRFPLVNDMRNKIRNLDAKGRYALPPNPATKLSRSWIFGQHPPCIDFD